MPGIKNHKCVDILYGFYLKRINNKHIIYNVLKYRDIYLHGIDFASSNIEITDASQMRARFTDQVFCSGINHAFSRSNISSN